MSPPLRLCYGLLLTLFPTALAVCAQLAKVAKNQSAYSCVGDKYPGAAAPTWQDFMNTGIQTGMGFAMAGSQTASDYGSGKGDNKATQDTYMQLSQGAGNKFMTMGSAASSQGQKLRQAAAGAKRPSTVPPAAVMGLAALGLAAAALAIGRRNKAAEVSTAAAPSPMPMV
mmetsp:Transcript_35827/g.117068  ORF Transcript_35827/g.117068 Transcript_35827/m.117068 type:complete len:170 (-) Transcript_35827:429-938(-)